MSDETFETLDTFWGHAEELRKTIVHSLFLILSCVLIALFFYQNIFNFIQKPLLNQPEGLKSIHLKKEQILNTSSKNKIYTLPIDSRMLSLSEDVIQIDASTFKLPPNAFLTYEKQEEGKPLAILSPIDGMTTVLKVSFFIGLLSASPGWSFFILRFLAPSLKNSVKQLIAPFILSSFLFICLGVSFAFFITIPIANNYLRLFNAGIGTNFWTLANYIDYTFFLALGNGISFESAVIAIFLVHYGFLTSQQMMSKRRHFIVAAFIIGALLTPPDVLTQIMLAIPLILLYEFIILYAKFLERKKSFQTAKHVA